ncbi:MAG: coenzyme F420-0:L-glutamate ligase, partial [Chloroflexi bacterium]|nr:coenzyme F420-0:L-glutamate ligase [Chloroflexota bacterium]
MVPLTLTPLQDIPLIRHGDDLADVILHSLRSSNINLEDNDILVLAQKIVSKAEGRMVNLATVTPSERAKELAAQTDKDARVVELMLQESNAVLRTRPGTIIVEHKLGFVCANAGIDHSNVAPLQLPQNSVNLGGKKEGGEEDWVLLLPENPDQSAINIRAKIEKTTNKKIGV